MANTTPDAHHEAAITWLGASGTHVAEVNTGKKYNDREVAGLAMALTQRFGENRTAVLSEIGDTYWCMKWSSFMGSLALTDFELILEDILGRNDQSYQRIIAADKDRRLLLVARSTNVLGLDHERILDRAVVAGAIDGGSTDEGQRVASTVLSSIKANINPVGLTHYHFSYDGREGLATRLKQLDDAGVEYSDWVPGQHLEVDLTSSFGHIKYDIWQQDQEAVFSRLPDWVRNFMNQDVEDLDFRKWRERHRKNTD